MMNLTDARQAVADGLSAVDGLNVHAAPPVRNPRPGDGWVVVQRMTPQDFRRFGVTLLVAIVLGQDVASSEELFNTLAMDTIDAAYGVQGLPVADVVLETDSVVLDGGSPLNIATLSLVTEVDR